MLPYLKKKENGNKKSQKHIKIFYLYFIMNKTIYEFICKTCNYKTNNKYDFKKHQKTRKHILQISNNICNEKFTCETCFKNYKTKSGLWKHKKSCTENFVEEKQNIIIKNQAEQIAELKKTMSSILEDNKESRILLKEIIPKMGNTNITNNYNNKISINVFLNDYCKDAINFQEFIDKIQVTVDDLLQTKEIGYSKGITNIFMKNLKNLEINERPIHCSDKKRLQFYVKEEDVWNKDCGEKVKNAITTCHKKQIDLIKDWEEKNPNWKNEENKRIEYLRIISEIMGGTSKEEIEKNNKDIIKNIGDNVLIKDALTTNEILNV